MPLTLVNQLQIYVTNLIVQYCFTSIYKKNFMV
jgi:hypothetical protein